MEAETAERFTRGYEQARRAYEYGRLRSSVSRALVVALPISALGLATAGRASWIVLPFAVSAWVLAYWRGGALLRGSFYGLLGGLVTAALPMSILRPCCATQMAPGVDCCTMPGACLAAGAVVGIALAAVVPFGKASWWRVALGMALGMSSVAVFKCTTLFAGEAVGLAGGLVAGLAAASAARSLLRSRIAG